MWKDIKLFGWQDNLTWIEKWTMNGNQESIHILLENDTYQATFLNTASHVRLLDKYGTFCTELTPLESGQLESLQFLINQGTEVNAKDVKGNALLANAVAYPACVEYLMRYGADVNITDINGSSALMKAVAGGHVRSVQFLLNGKPFINTRNKYGFTALIQAARNGRTHCAKLLLEYSADVNMVDKGGYSALIHAAVKQSVGCVRLLLGAGVIIDRNIYESMYCLLKTWESAIINEQIILMLFAGGADKPQTNRRGTSIYWRNLTECLKQYTSDEDVSLRHLCRTTIRNQLLVKHRKKNLYFSVSKLGLPPLLQSYLLYNMVSSQ